MILRVKRLVYLHPVNKWIRYVSKLHTGFYSVIKGSFVFGYRPSELKNYKGKYKILPHEEYFPKLVKNIVEIISAYVYFCTIQ